MVLLHRFREVWTTNFKSSVAVENDVQEDDVEMTVEGGSSGSGAPADEDPFEKQMLLKLSMSYKSELRQHKDMARQSARSIGGLDQRKPNSLHL